MSQSPIARTKPLGSTMAAGRVPRSLCLALGLICAAAAAASAQQAQTVKSDRPIECNGVPYTLRLVRTEAPFKNSNAKALGVVLVPGVAADSKAFFLYWLDEQSAEPTHRDNTDGKLSGGGLIPYGDVKVGSGRVSATQDFFSNAKCPSEDPQVLAVQNILGNAHAAPADLRGLAGSLGAQVGVKAELVEDAPSSELGVLSKLSSEADFYKGTRQYVSDLLSPRGAITDPGQPKISWEDERKAFLDKVAELGGQVDALKKEKDSFFGATPRWFVALFLFISVVALMAVAGTARGIYQYRKKSSDTNDADAAHPLPEPGAGTGAEMEALNGQAHQISDSLAGIIHNARGRRRDISKKYAGAFQTGGGPHWREEDHDTLALTETILNRLKKFLHPQDYGDAKNIIKAELQRARGAVGPYRQLAGELNAAYTNLQDHLEALRKTLSGEVDETPANSEPPSRSHDSALTVVVRSMADGLDRLEADVAVMKGNVGNCDVKLGALSQLAASVDAVKSRVDGFDLKLAEYFKVNQGLRILGTHWYGPSYSEGQADELIRKVREAIDLYQLLSRRCGHNGASVAQTRDCLLNTLDTLKAIRDTHLGDSLGEAALPHQIAAKVKLKLSDDATLTKEYRGIEQSLRNHFGDRMKAAETVAKLIEERSVARKKLGKYHPGPELTQTVDAVVATYDAIKGEVQRALPDAGGTLPEAVASLATGYLALKPAADRTGALEAEVGGLREQLTATSAESAAGRELAGEIARQLNFKADRSAEDPGLVASALDLLKKEKAEGVYLQLRLGLSSALMTLDKATGEGGSDERREVADALLLENVKKGIRELLAGMEDYSGEQLWNRGIFLGFDDKWLHYLIRADLLLRTYYADRKEFGPLRKAVSLACSALLAALYEFQVEVVEVGLFEELPRDMETAPVYPGVRNLPAVREKVRSTIQSAVVKEVVIDVTSFPYLVKGVQANRGCASLANPSAWVQH